MTPPLSSYGDGDDDGGGGGGGSQQRNSAGGPADVVFRPMGRWGGWVEYTYGTPMSVLPSFAERKHGCSVGVLFPDGADVVFSDTGRHVHVCRWRWYLADRASRFLSCVCSQLSYKVQLTLNYVNIIYSYYSKFYAQEMKQ